MGLEFLARVRKTSTWLGGVVALMAATYASPLRVLAVGAWFALGALTSAGGAPPAPAAERSAAASAAGGDAHGTAVGEAASPEAPESSEKEEGFTNIIALVAGANPHAAWAHFLEHYEVLI